MDTNTTAPRTFIDLDDPVLKRLLREGLALPHDPNFGLVILLRGKPGTGKSTLALQLLDRIRPKGGTRYYCTLEQSKQDLQFKLASMLAAKALQDALQPDYPNQIFNYNPDGIISYLAPRLEKDLTTSITALCSKLKQEEKLLLFDEPRQEQRQANNDLLRDLSIAVSSALKKDHIKISDSSSASQFRGNQGPFGTVRSRVVLAPHLLHNATTEAYEIDAKWRARIEAAAGDPKTEPPKRLPDERDQLPIVVLDGLSLLSTTERDAIELQRIVELMRRNFQLSILVYEPNEDESTSLDHHADLVIELAKRIIEKPLAYTIHELCMRKARYQEAALGQHQFKIRGSGIAIFPSLHFQVHHHNYMDLELKRSSSTKQWSPAPPESRGHKHFAGTAASFPGSLIDLIFDPQDGESIVLLGSRNSFKTQLCLDFLARGFWGCPTINPVTDKASPNSAAEPGLLVSLIDNAPDIERGLDCPWHKTLASQCQWPSTNCKSCQSHLLLHARAFCQRPGCITPAEFFEYLRQRILPTINGKESDRPAAKRVAFWDLTQMDYRFPLFKEDKMLLPALMDFFKTKTIKSLFMGAGNADNTKAASAMADHVLFCWRSASKSKRADVKAPTLASTIATSTSSLMLYVDRAAPTSGQSGKALYRVPIFNEAQKEDRLMVPYSVAELTTPESEGGYRVDLAALMGQVDGDDDKEQIKRITNMQGVS